MGTGAAKLTCCQPDAVSLVNVAVANSSPVLVHRLPVWTPEFPGPLKKRMPLIVPATSERNLTPSSTAFGSFSDATAGVAPASQIVHGQAGPVLVVKDQVRSAPSELPARSVALGALPAPASLAV